MTLAVNSYHSSIGICADRKAAGYALYRSSQNISGIVPYGLVNVNNLITNKNNMYFYETIIAFVCGLWYSKLMNRTK